MNHDPEWRDVVATLGMLLLLLYGIANIMIGLDMRPACDWNTHMAIGSTSVILGGVGLVFSIAYWVGVLVRRLRKRGLGE